jgi:arginine/ornithine N-succinyltransferase beta subunit
LNSFRATRAAVKLEGGTAVISTPAAQALGVSDGDTVRITT